MILIYMTSNAKKLISKIKSLSEQDKEELYDFIILEKAKNLNPEERKLLKFGIKSTNKLKDWNKKAAEALKQSRRFTNELKKRA